MSLYSPIRLHAKLDPNRLAIVGMGTYVEAISFGQLNRLVELFIQLYDASGLERDCTVSLDLADGMATFLALLAFSEFPVRSIATRYDAGSPGDIVLYDGSQPSGPAAKAIHVDFPGILASEGLNNPPASRSDGNTGFVFTDPDAPGSRSLTLDPQMIEARVAARTLVCRASGGRTWMCAADPASELDSRHSLASFALVRVSAYPAGPFLRTFWQWAFTQLRAS